MSQTAERIHELVDKLNLYCDEYYNKMRSLHRRASVKNPMKT